MIKKSLLVGTLAAAAAAAGAVVAPTAADDPRTAVRTRTAAAPAPASASAGPVGFASMNGGTTGGAAGATVTASTAAQLAAYATARVPYVIRITGTVRVPGMQRVGSDKTIVGVGASGRITGGGLNVSGARNVVIRNLTFSGASDDAINVERSTNVWIDHNDLSGAADGLTDVKRGSDYVTVSWNRYHDHDKTALLGHSDDNGAEDRGRLRVTYVHNWFDGTNQRHPRVRFANPVHVLNNYYRDIGGYGVASTEGAGVLVEANHFENVEEPTSVREGSSGEGNFRILNNRLVGSGRPVDRNPWAVAAIPYRYTPESAASVKATVMAGAGVGKV
ncbi:pectate lyase family protein [Actinomadura sediminis]|uniref:Polysaccharide lyase family 1 protein n=1 Tax=Actinomadura sediminis TaxID=1038904 RepID=A0ABW3EEV9_9ACTN